MSHLQDIATRLQVYLEGLKAGEFTDFNQFLAEVEQNLRMNMARGELVDLTRTQLEAFVVKLRKLNVATTATALDDFVLTLIDLAGYSLTTETEALQSVIAAVESKRIKDSTLWRAVSQRPMSVNGELMMPWMQRSLDNNVLAVESLVRRGYSEHWSNEEILKVLRGTKTNRYSDGLMMKMGRQNKTMVNTAIQHVNSVARQEVWEANKDVLIGYKWVSTLDRRTSDECRAMDGRVFKFGEGPLPPIHMNCRSTTVAVASSLYDFLDQDATRAAEGGAVDADMSYYAWLKTQSAEFQDSVLGPTRGALLRDGGLTAEEFARLQLNSTFQPLTLDELRKRAPLAFKRAGV